MSAAASKWAWSVRGVSPTQKLVLVCLADHAGKDGTNCFPSVARIVDECCLSERTVRYSLRELEALGLIKSEHRAGRSTNYFLPVEGGQEMPPARDAPLQEMPPRGARDAGEGGKRCPHNHNLTVTEPVKRKSELDTSPLPDDLDPAIWSDFVKMRRQMKKPLTDTAVKMLATQLEKCRSVGFSPNEALGAAVERAWLSVKPDWLQNSRQQATPAPRILTDA